MQDRIALVAELYALVFRWQKSCSPQSIVKRLVIGPTASENSLGGSEYLKVIHGKVTGIPPAIDLEEEIAVQKTCREAGRRGVISSAHDCSEGGLAVALAESCMSGGAKIGAEAEVQGKMRKDELLFGETQSRIIVSLREEKLKALKQIAGKHGAPIRVIGRTGGRKLVVRGLIDMEIGEIYDAWSGSIPRRLGLKKQG